MKIIKCKTCSKEIKIYPYQEGKTFFCSRRCWSVDCKNNRILKNCAACGKSFSVYPSLDRIRYCSGKCRGTINIGKGYWTGKKRPDISGEKSGTWKGGITPWKKALRNALAYKAWRRLVFHRDNYTCQECGKYSGYLEAHHIIPIKKSIELISEVNNGITLCRPCHIKTMGKEKLFEKKYSLIASSC